MTPERFHKILQMLIRGATMGERTAAHAVAQKAVDKHGLRKCFPNHPLNGEEVLSEWDIVEVAESMWDFGPYGGKRKVELEVFSSFFMGIPAFGAKTAGRAVCIIKARLRNGWTAGRDGVWGGGRDLEFLNVMEWGFERAFKHAADLEGWSEADCERFIESRTASIAAHLREHHALAA